MSGFQASIGQLKSVLEHLNNPGELDEHPWTTSLFVQDVTSKDPTLASKSPGFRLAVATAELFKTMIPGTPPKRAKRIDTRWGKFGILAAQYFAPYLFGTPPPATLLDVWGAIDQAILLFVFGKREELLSEEEISTYKLVGNEFDVAARSTLSDWQRMGIRQLADLITHHENYLALSDSTSLAKNQAVPHQKSRRFGKRLGWLSLGLILIFLVAVGWKGWRIYQLANKVQVDVNQLRGMVSGSLNIDQFRLAGPLMTRLSQDVAGLHDEAVPILRPLGPWLEWIPTYGPDLAAGADLLETAHQAATSLQTAYQATEPLLEPRTNPLTLPELANILVLGQPQFLLAQTELSAAQAARSRVNPDKLSPRFQKLLGEFDSLLGPLDDGLSMAIVMPGLLGASSEGPKTYMILLQNEDELRPTGGFIGTVGSFVIRNGIPFGIKFADSYSFDNWDKAYPEPPWQLEKYMQAPVLVLRDANWFTNFPTTASWVEYLYSLKDDHSVDGIIAIDQEVIRIVLQVIGPVSVEGVSDPVNAQTVKQFMRDAKEPPPGTENLQEWLLQHRKDFVSPLGEAILARLISGKDIDYEKLLRALFKAMDEHHILIQMDDPQITAVITRHNWDGAVRPGTGDFLMVVDSNIGINKTNMVMDEKLSYDVDLTNLEKPVGSLVVFQTNHASLDSSCQKYRSGDKSGKAAYGYNSCYWDYLRVYVAKESSLKSATPHAIAAEGTLFGESVPAQVDAMDMKEEGIETAQGFGTLLGVAGGETLSTGFDFYLPASILAQQADTGFRAYTLKIQKQPGTIAIPITIRVHLPANASISVAPSGVVIDGSNILLDTDLRTDINFEVIFTVH